MNSATKKPSRKKAVSPKTPAPSLVWYRRIAITFVAITFLTLAVVVYLSFSRATVHIVAEGLEVETLFVADVVDVSASANETEGKVLSNVFTELAEHKGYFGKNIRKVYWQKIGFFRVKCGILGLKVRNVDEFLTKNNGRLDSRMPSVLNV